MKWEDMEYSAEELQWIKEHSEHGDHWATWKNYDFETGLADGGIKCLGCGSEIYVGRCEA